MDAKNQIARRIELLDPLLTIGFKLRPIYLMAVYIPNAASSVPRSISGTARVVRISAKDELTFRNITYTIFIKTLNKISRFSPHKPVRQLSQMQNHILLVSDRGRCQRCFINIMISSHHLFSYSRFRELLPSSYLTTRGDYSQVYIDLLNIFYCRRTFKPLLILQAHILKIKSNPQEVTGIQTIFI